MLNRISCFFMCSYDIISNALVKFISEEIMNEKKEIKPGAIGGQAVIEGVMMRGKKMYAMAVRKPDNEIEVVKKDIASFSDKASIFKLPILRGMSAFVDSLVIGMKIISDSAEIAMVEEAVEQPSKFEQFLVKVFGEKLNDIFIYISVFFAIIFSIGFFILLPTWLVGFTKGFIGGHTWALGIVEGIVRICILVIYLFLISRMKDIQRVFAYHGAEHKTINCYESGATLTVENVKKHTRLHKRCGTSFLLIVMIISMVVFFFVRTDVVLLRFGYRIILVPIIAGISYEVIRYAGRHESLLTDILSAPGMLLQKLTTLEPDEGQIEVAIKAMNEVLENETK